MDILLSPYQEDLKMFGDHFSFHFTARNKNYQLLST